VAESGVPASSTGPHALSSLGCDKQSIQRGPLWLQGLDMFGGQVPDERAVLEWQQQHPEDRAVFLSDCWLDRPEVLEKLTTILAGV